MACLHHRLQSCLRSLALLNIRHAPNASAHSLQAFSTTSPSLAKPLPPRRVIPDSEITENFLKGSGPGGQKINKTSSAVQLIHHPTGIVVKYQDTRSREQNRKMARKILGERLEELELGEGARTRVKAKELGRKKASSMKKKRRKYRALEAAKAGDEGGQEDDHVVDGDGVDEHVETLPKKPVDQGDAAHVAKDG